MPTIVGGRGIAEKICDRRTNQDGRKSCVLSSSVSTSAATFPMGEGLDRLSLNGSKITTALRWLRKRFNRPWHRSTQRRGDKRRAPQGYLLRGTEADLIASHAPLRSGRHKARQVYTKLLTPGDSRGPPTGAPPKPNASGFGGERRSNGMTELLPLKAKRRIWSLRRRGTPFSSIFRRATKDGATGGRRLPNAANKNAKS